MPAFLQNKTVQIIGGIVVLLVVGFIALAVLASLNTARNSIGFSSDLAYVDSMPGIQASNKVGYAETEMAAYGGDGIGYYPTPTPNADYTADLELYETTDYTIGGRIKRFDEACDTLAELKASDRYHFKYLNDSLNNCSATFFTELDEAGAAVAAFEAFNGVTVTRSTMSVTRHRQQIESRTTTVTAQLNSVERTLQEAETGLNEIVTFARENKNAKALSEAVRAKLELIDTLTQRKIQLTAQLDTLYQQAADLNERMDVAQFSVSLTRAYPLYPDKKARLWENAWRELDDTFTYTLIGLSANFGIFLLWTLRLAIYGLVLIVVLRALWKFVRLVWKY